MTPAIESRPNPLKALQRRGQSVWMDYIRRSLMASGKLRSLIAEDGLSGMTSNPTIFDKAIGGSSDYDESLRKVLARDPDALSPALFQVLAIEDIRMAADELRPIYDKTGGADGFVSLEVSPGLAYDTAGTVAEARRLWKAVSRPNMMIKIPATREGIPAIETMLAEAVNINITLMFSMAHYEAVAGAFLRGLARCPEPQKVASVASFFVSRVDTVVDKDLDRIGNAEALSLRGKIAIANSRLVYQRFQEIFYGEPFAALRRKGAKVQRPLWASTSTKNPAYPDTLYVAELVGPDTVNTMPVETMDAFRDHGKVRGDTVKDAAAEARASLEHLAKLGIDLDAITAKLQTDGVTSFANSFNDLMSTLDQKRTSILGPQIDRQSMSLGSGQPNVDQRLKDWQTADFAARLWRKDPAVWSKDPQVKELTDRLGWLTLPGEMREKAEDLAAFAQEVKSGGIRHVVLLGMGGSSLAPEVFQRTFGNAPGYPELIVLDSTHPDSVREVERRIVPRKSLFLVSSKSGTTTETLSFFHYFWKVVSDSAPESGLHFVAITDPGTPLEKLAARYKFRRTFPGAADVGGRYSALSNFGLVPAALIGVDIARLLDLAWQMSEACGFSVASADNPALALGAALGELARGGRDKVTFFASPALGAMPIWIEQLIAESTGKDGKGIVPVAGEPAGPPEVYGSDRVFVRLSLEGETPDGRAKVPDSHPVIDIRMREKADLGQEFFRWELAIAAAGAVLGIHPFNQPDVQLAKELARKAMGATAPGTDSGGELFSPSEAKAFLSQARPGDYISLQAYLEPNPATDAALQGLRTVLRNKLRVATTVGYGPRFLHSTGQLHKGGPDSGVFLQLLDEPAEDLAVPETSFTFCELIKAQALGDYEALRQRNRRVLRINLGRDAAEALKRLTASI